jgi:hypothetical protein
MASEDLLYPDDIRREFERLEQKFGVVKLSGQALEGFRRFDNIQGEVDIDHLKMIHGWLPLSAAAVRTSYLESLADMKLAIYGSGWENSKELKRCSRGWVQPTELPKVFNAAKINIHLGTFTNNHPKIFETIASGGFMLARLTPEDEGPGGIGDVFKIGREIEVFRDKKELRDKIHYYLKHEDQRRAIAQRGLQRLLSEHTMEHRMRHVLEIVYRGLNA